MDVGILIRHWNSRRFYPHGAERTAVFFSKKKNDDKSLISTQKYESGPIAAGRCGLRCEFTSHILTSFSSPWLDCVGSGDLVVAIAC